MQGLIFANIAASAAIVMILLLRKFFKDKVYSKVFVLLWALVILRLLVPFEFSSALSIYPSETQVSSPIPEDNVQIQWDTLPQYDETAFMTEYEPAEEPAKPIAKISSAEAFFIIWLMGAVSVGGYFTLCHLNTVRKIKANCAPLEDIPNVLPPGKARFLKSKKLASPLSFGLFKPTAVIPENISEEQLPFVILHEHTHIKDRDAALKTAAVFALALHWFNPLVWIAVRYFDRDIERYCDERVLSKIGSEKAAQYANAILDFAEKESLSASLSFFSAASLEERVISIMKNKTKRGHLPAVIAVFAATLLIMTACGTAPEPETPKKPDSAENVYSDSRILYLYPTSAQPMCYEGDEFFETYSSTGGDMIAQPESTKVYASAEGTVLKAVNDSEKLGNYIVIDHADGNQTLYAFCGKLLAEEGQTVSSGEVISELGTRVLEGDEGKRFLNYVYFRIIAGGGFDYESYGGEKTVDISTGETSTHHTDSHGTGTHHTENHETEPHHVNSGYLSPISKLPLDDDHSAFYSGGTFQAEYGAPIYASNNGIVSAVVTGHEGLGNYIVIDHPEGYQSLYGFCGKMILVSEGYPVSAGELIADVGADGYDPIGETYSLYFRIITEGGFSPEDYINVQNRFGTSEGTVASGYVTEISAEEERKDLEQSIEEINKTLQNAIEFVWPCESTSVAALMNGYPGHSGVDIGGGRGLDIYAAADGTVTKVDWGKTGYGYYLVISHDSGFYTLYAHCSEILVEVGQKVSAGELIAKTGSTGNSTGAHLHFEVIFEGENLDPLEYVVP